MDADDIEAVNSVQNGDIDAFSRLVHKYTPLLAGFIGAKTKDTDMADDVVQIAFIRLYKAIDRLDTTRPLQPYLFQIAKNELYEQWNKNKRTTPLNHAVHASVDTHYEESFQIDEAKGALGELKPDQKNALLWFSEGYSYDEIAQKMGRPINTVRTLIRRARLFIQHKMKV
jgi:RNA polymerase sigma-70 factor (ECF subfamily)